jgi:bifunctional DNA-binding transcriptional regulator/antitoxin component of YhaV-PrlF toxin-antitoxin module
MGLGQITTLNKANATSNSLRTTVPVDIIKLYELKEGDKIKWDLEVEKGKIIVKVRPVVEKKR